MNAEADRIHRLFGGDNFKFARWSGSIAPMVMGLDDSGAKLFGQAISAVADLAGVEISETDPEMGANMMVFVMNDWFDALQAPLLPNFLPDLDQLIDRLTLANANRYRVFAFDDAGAIRASITLLRYDDKMKAAPVDYIALTEAVLAMLVYDEQGVANDRPVVMAELGENGEQVAVVDPWHAFLIRAAYDSSIPAGSNNPTLCMRLAARIGVLQAAVEAGQPAGADDA